MDAFNSHAPEFHGAHVGLRCANPTYVFTNYKATSVLLGRSV